MSAPVQVRITPKIDPDVYRRLRTHAAWRGLELQTVVNTALREWLAENFYENDWPKASKETP